MIFDIILWEFKGWLDLSCIRCLFLDKFFIWKKLESGSGKIFFILDMLLVDLIFISRFVFIFLCCFFFIWYVNMVVFGCLKIKKFILWIFL